MDALVENGIYRVGENENLPTQVYYSQAIVCRGKNSDTVVQIVIDYDGATMMFRGASNTSGQWDWVDWQQVAIAAPPQEFDLPLESAFQNFLQERSVYRKDQFGVVNLDISVQPVSEIAVDTVIAYLPEGFRPAKNKRAAAIAVTPENECIAFPLFVGTSGMVSIAFFSAQPAQYKAIIGQIEFVAAG